MKKNSRRIKQKTLKSLLKRVSKAAVLASGLLLSIPAAANTVSTKPGHETIEQRVNTVRKSLRKKLDANQNVEEKLSYSELELAQWGNWGNWGNWNNWRNWNNWNNWGNWGNWRNF